MRDGLGGRARTGKRRAGALLLGLLAACAGAVLLAADALTGHTGASRLFTSVELLGGAEARESARPPRL